MVKSFIKKKRKARSTTLVSAACEYVKEGFKILPLFGIENGECLCRIDACSSPGKHPIGTLVPNGEKDATDDIKIIRKWWKKHPKANIGLTTTGLLVVDVDGKPGLASLKKLPNLPKTAKVKTGRGFHLYYRFGDLTKLNKYEGIDLKTGKGYVVAAPSQHASGKKYKFVNGLDKMVSLPQHIIDQLKPKPVVLSKSKKIRKGGRNNALASFAGMVRSLGLNEGQIAELLYKYNELLCSPPLDEDEVARVAKSIARYDARGDDDELFANMSEVEAKEIEFLIDPLIVLGGMTLLEGDPAGGKSFITMDLVASITTGKKFGIYKPLVTGHVLILSAEDDPETILINRLVAQGADVSKVRYMRNLRSLDFETINKMREELIAYPAKLVIIDPVIAFMPGESDMNDANKVRQFLMPLQLLAKEFNLAILLVRHLRKAGTDSAKYRGLGSIDFIATVRSSLVVYEDPDELNLKVMAHDKASYSLKGVSLKYSIDPIEGTRNAKLTWQGESDFSADELNQQSTKKTTQIDKAVEFLKQTIPDDGMEANLVWAQSKDRGFSASTINRAKSQLKIRSTKGPSSKWFLS